MISNNDLRHDAFGKDVLRLHQTVCNALLMGVERHLFPGLVVLSIPYGNKSASGRQTTPHPELVEG
jgi:hypothetical protein